MKEGVAEPADEALARRAQNGDRAALERLVRRYLRRIHAVVASYLPERADVEDTVQEAFLRAIARIDGYDPRRPFAPWLYQVARNTARDRIAANARVHADPLADDIVEPRRGPLADAEHADTRTRVAAALSTLPEQRRTAFRLHDVEGYDAEEIAVLMGITAGTVRSHVHYARRALRAALAVEREP